MSLKGRSGLSFRRQVRDVWVSCDRVAAICQQLQFIN